MLAIFTAMSVVAAIFVARGHALTANAIWILTNTVFVAHNYKIDEYEMMAMFAAYLLISVYGVHHLSRNNIIDEVIHNGNK